MLRSFIEEKFEVCLRSSLLVAYAGPMTAAGFSCFSSAAAPVEVAGLESSGAQNRNPAEMRLNVRRLRCGNMQDSLA